MERLQKNAVSEIEHAQFSVYQALLSAHAESLGTRLGMYLIHYIIHTMLIVMYLWLKVYCGWLC